MTTDSSSKDTKFLKDWEIAPHEAKHTLSAWVVVVLTVLAVLLGLVMKNGVDTATFAYDRGGVTANVPQRWQVTNGFGNQDPLAFSAKNPLDPMLAYSVYLLPGGADVKPEDLANNSTLEGVRLLNNYRVLDQQNVQVAGQDAYKVHYVFINPGSTMQLPVVVEGVTYYFATQPKALAIKMEDETSRFEEALPRFLKFVETVKLTEGGE